MIMYFSCLLKRKKKQLKNVGILVVRSGHFGNIGWAGLTTQHILCLISNCANETLEKQPFRCARSAVSVVVFVLSFSVL